MNNNQTKLYQDMICSMKLFKNSLNDNTEDEKNLIVFMNSILMRCDEKIKLYKPKKYVFVIKRGKFKLSG